MSSSVKTTDDCLPASVPEMTGQRLELKLEVTPDSVSTLVDFLHWHCTLSKQQLKDAANKGAVLLRRAGSVRRLRRAKAELKPGDRIELHYDAQLLALQSPPARCIADRITYSVWCKPAGMLAQGNEFGDHCALTRCAETAFTPPRPVWLIHRLDREATGLMVLAHSKGAAASLSRQFQSQSVIKRYRVLVVGDIAARYGQQHRFELPLDGKPACTDYRLLHWDPATQRATLEVQIGSGRLHQIRRHLADAGFPVLGDPRYGRGNKDSAGLRLAAIGLSFICPSSRQRVDYALDAADMGF